MSILGHPDLDPLLHGSPLRRPAVAIGIAAALLATLGAVAVIHLGMLAAMRSDVATVFLRALALATLMSAVPLTLLWFLDRRERETPSLLVAAFLWGAFIATGLALPVNNAFFTVIGRWVARNPVIEQVLGPEATTMLVAPVAGPLVEEITKGLGLAALFYLLRAEFDDMRDGFVYGALIGAGFTWFEAPLYVAQGYAEFGVAPYGAQLGWRYALFGLSGHVMFTGIFGAFFGLAIQTRRRWVRIAAPLTGLALAIAAHVLNNALPLLFALAGAASGEPPQGSEPPLDLGFVDAWVSGTLVDLTIFLPFVAVIALILWRSGLWERRVIREELAGEIGHAVTAREFEQIRRDGIFRTRRIDQAHSRESAALVNAQHELAFRKRRVRDEGRDTDADPLVARWRAEIARRRAALG